MGIYEKQIVSDIKYLNSNSKFGKPLKSFYQSGAWNSSNLTPYIRRCLSRVYGKGITKFNIRN